MCRYKNKGQQFAMDFILGVSLFILILSFTLYIWSKNINRIQEKEILDELFISNQQASDLLVKTRGMPTDWESNPQGASSIGLVSDTDRIILESKLDSFISMNYTHSKEIMGIGNYDYHFQLLDPTQKVINESGVPPEGDLQISIRRIVTYKESSAILDLTVWTTAGEGRIRAVPPI
ncbi:hypothetical protein ACFLRC_04310 [Candidatus Altiarchaeota archaeon]